MAPHYLARFQDTTKKYWDSKAVCDFMGEEFTFGQMATCIEKNHIILEKAGVKKGDKVSLCAKNCARWAVSYLAMNTYEAVSVPILADFHPDSICHLVEHSGSAILYTDTDHFKSLDLSKMPNVKGIIDIADFSLLFCNDEALKDAVENIDKYFAEKWPNGYTAADVVFPVDNMSDIAVINYTSGTTSAPKGVMLTYEAISATTDFGTRYIPCTPDDSIVSMLPMAHIYGFAYEFLYPLSNGVTVYYLGKTPSPSILIKAMQEVKPYILITVPLVMEKIYKSSLKPVLDKPAMKILTKIPGVNKIIYKKISGKLIDTFGGKVSQIIMGGAALNPEVEELFRKIGLPYTVGYGMTEAAPLLAYQRPAQFAQGSCGVAIDCTQVRIDSEDPQHIAGEIQAKGPNITLGYYNAPEATANAFTEDGWLKTGDLGVMDAQGNIFIRGRSKNMILSANGQNIYPEEVEAVINSKDYVAESVVVDRASKLVALVYLDDAAIKKAGLDNETIAGIPENIRISSNKMLPNYSQITKVEIMTEPFVKTPKMSIKRFMYK